jgi:hypothetical protein
MKRIFSSLNRTAVVTKYSIKKTYAVTKYLKRKIASLDATRWFFSSILVNAIQERRVQTLDYLAALTSRRGEWND